MPQVVIIGGGAAGLCAAIALKNRAPSVKLTVLEKKDRIGKKILATGNGRCNLSNRDMSLDHFHGSLSGLVPSVFEAFGPDETEAFWNAIGIELKELEEGRLYPYSLQASAVLDALRFELERLDVTVQTETRVSGISRRKNGYEISAVSQGVQKKFPADAVIMAAGGAASPAFGSNGDGERLCRALGLACAEPQPALCRLCSSAPELKSLAGTKAVCTLSLSDAAGNLLDSRRGELLFTQEGLSGPPILQFSRQAGEACRKDGSCLIQADFFPEFSSGELFAKLMKRFASLSHLSVQEALGSLVNKRISAVAIRRAGLSQNTSCASLGKKETGALTAQLKGLRYEITGPEGFEEAQVSTGGVLAEELDAALQARHFPGLFLCGEVLDLDGDCGGYNLQWAVSSACLAAKSAAGYLHAED